jgi:hypothetical protein
VDCKAGKVRLPAQGAMALTANFDAFLDRFAIADPRLVHAHVEPIIAEQAVLDHFQMQLTHSADEGLAGFLIFAGSKRRILPFHHFQYVSELLPFR